MRQAVKKAEYQRTDTVVLEKILFFFLEKILESSLDSEIKPINPKENQS